MTADDAIAFVRHHGIVLASARGPVPRLAEAIAGEAIKGSWWAHPKSHSIFRILEALARSPDILTCRLVGGKVTFVHRRLWPALVRTAGGFDRDRLAQVEQEHTAAGYHVSRDIPFPKWVPREVMEEARSLSEEEARSALAALFLPSAKAVDTGRGKAPRRTTGRRGQSGR
ncbi:MAG TPA: hypothetical protein VH183_04325 [Burkholderiaceae bacterium]|nr:hypothetical protein [Burkholderiaceae bacterium]